MKFEISNDIILLTSIYLVISIVSVTYMYCHYENIIDSYDVYVDRIESEKINLSYSIEIRDVQIYNLNNSYNELKENYAYLEYRKSKESHVPTEEEVRKLILQNDINENIWDEDNYDCSEFSNELISYLNEKGIFSCITEIEYGDSKYGHAIVAVNTTTRLLYIDPQTDKVSYSIEDKFDGYDINTISSCYGFERRY